MKTRELIAKLRELDPGGERPVFLVDEWNGAHEPEPSAIWVDDAERPEKVQAMRTEQAKVEAILI